MNEPTSSEPQPGLPVVRTMLAWQRTGLSVAAAATVLTRLAYEEIGSWALLLLPVCLGLCGWVMSQSRGRLHRRSGAAVRPFPVGVWAAAVVGSVVLMGVVELAVILV